MSRKEVGYDFLVGAVMGAIGGSIEQVGEATGLKAPDERSEFFMQAGEQGLSFEQAQSKWSSRNELEDASGTDAAAETEGDKSDAEKYLQRLEEIGYLPAEQAETENTAHDGAAESTAVNTDPEDHTRAEQATIEKYQEAVDQSFKAMIEKYEQADNPGFMRKTLSKVSQRQANDIAAILGGNYMGFSNAINSNGIQHILKEHGKKGAVDHSMANVNDIARLAYILDNYDSVEQAKYSSGEPKTSKEFRKADNTPAPMLVYKKKVNGTFYAVEAVPDSTYKKLWVVSAYMEKSEGGTQAPNGIPLGNTSETSLTSSPSKNSVASSSGAVNTPANAKEADTARPGIRAEAQKRGAEKRRKGTVSVDGAEINGKKYKGVNEKKLTTSQKKVVAMVRALADAVNIDYVVYDGNPDEGGSYIKGGTVLININSGQLSTKNLGAATVSHELTHYLQDFAPEEYEQLKGFITQHIMKKSPAQFDALVRQQQKLDPKLSYDKAVDELVANACQTMLLNSRAVTQLARQNMTLAEKIQDAIADISEKIKAAFEGVDLKDDVRVYQAAREISDVMDQVQELWDKALLAADASYNAVEQTGMRSASDTSGEMQRHATKIERKDLFERDKYFDRQIDKWNDLKDGARVKVGILKEGSALNRVGFPATDMWFDVGKIKKSFGTHGDHLTKAILKAIPNMLNSPIAITEYRGAKGDVENTVTAYGILMPDGKTPVAVGVMMAKGRDGTTIINKIRTVHARGDAIINDQNILYLNEDKKRTRNWFQVCDISVPLEGTKFGLIRSIQYVDPKSKSQNQDEEQHQRWGMAETDEEREARRESVANLRTENRILRARAEYWKGQTQQTRERTVRQQDTDRLANDLLREYESRADKAEVKAALKELGDWRSRARPRSKA